MHPKILKKESGSCPICGMRLVQADSIIKKSSEENSYKPLVVIVGLIILVTITLAIKDSSSGVLEIKDVMSNFMAGFFLVFSSFKLMDLKGFADGYFSYDLLAKRIYVYGYIYPFLELLLGLAFLVHFTPPLVNIFTFLLMTFSGIGVALKLIRHEKFTCSCLGTFLKVPLTKVTLIEDFGMALMALLMIVMK